MLAVSPRVFVGFVMRIEIAQGALAFKQGGEQLPLDHLPPAAPSSSRALRSSQERPCGIRAALCNELGAG